MNAPPDSIRAAYDPEAFRKRAHHFVDQLADYLGRAERGEMPVLPLIDPEVEKGRWPPSFGPAPTREMKELLTDVIEHSNHFHHPRNIGHQVAAPLPDAALWDFASSILNNGMAVLETGPVSTPMERSVVRWMADAIGFGPGAEGVLTSGGSVGNLTSMLAARQAKAGFDAWTQGNQGAPLAVLASGQTHYCVKRSVQIMGWGDQGVVPVPVDGRFRMDVSALPAALAAAQKAGRKVIALVASAGSTATGAFDPLEPVADFCAQHGLWMHVDGAHGAPALLSDKYRSLLKGIERADSVVWDAHKMMMMPALVTGVVFREGHRSYETFAQEASYLFASGKAVHRQQWWNLGLRTLECTKRMMSLKVYASLATLGTQVFADAVTAAFDLGRWFGEQLQKADDFELATAPEGNIVCFRYRPTGAENLDRIQETIRARVLKSGSFYLVQTRLPAGIFLRVTLINPLTTQDDVLALMETIRKHGREA